MTEIKCYCGHTITCDCGPLPKQTAVEWLENQIKTSKYFYKVMKDINSRSTVAQSDIFEQAKAMEKEQIEKTFEEGMFHHINGLCPDEYYNETFKSE